VHQYFGVGATAEVVAPGLEIGPQLPVIVDLAVEDDLNPAVFVGHRLSAGGREIDQRQPAMDQLASLVYIVAPSIRAAMGEQGIRTACPARIGRECRRMESTGQAAHIRSSGA
jgi:hypothetical protein